MTHVMKVQETCTAPVVALHSSASGASQWDGLIADLSERYDVFAYDLPGYDPNFEPDEACNGLDALAGLVLDRIVELGQAVHLVGHSFGGCVAIKIALLRSDLVTSLTLYEPAAFTILKPGRPSDRLLLDGLQEIESKLAAAIAEGCPERGMQTFVDFWNGAGAWDQMSEALRKRLTGLAHIVARDFAVMFAETWANDDLTLLTTPTLLMMGMDSPAIAQRSVAMLVEQLPRTELAMLPGLGHMAPIFAPQWVNPRIVQHIARVERSAKIVSWPQMAAA